MKSDEKSYIAFALYDEQNNKIEDGSFAKNLTIQKVAGNADIKPFTYDPVQKQFNALIQP